MLADADSAARRWVLHIDMDAFFASVEQLTRPTLRGRPVLVGGTGGRGVVAGASYEARVFGARSAMPMHQARRLVGVTAVVVPPRGAVYGVVSGQVFDALRSRIPVLETLSYDEAFGEPAELAGATVARVHAFCEELRAVVRARTGLTASVGAGTGKQLAKIASGLAKPDGVRVISPVEQPRLLAGLPVRKLWGIGPVAEGRLRSLGIETVGAFAALPESEAMSILGGSIGAALHRLARGIDDRPVAERTEAKQISAETTYETDIVSLEQLRPAIEDMAAAAHRRLTGDGRAARTVVLKLKKSDMSIVTRSFTLPYATEDLATLAAAAQRSALDPRELGPIRLVGVGYGGLSTVRQESLFPELDRGTAGIASARPEPEQPQVADLGDADRTAPVLPIAAWHPGMDVSHPEHGHGWVQGAGLGVVTVRFETRSTGPGPARTFAADDAALTRADPLGSLR
ncbi:DNA polymerase IV [Nocardia sp. CDC186]|uniref:DNA polymerase IV n=2 Tax=Nocardia implantans TaxID=3108168 RepID=A0ABU6AR13_9NOCA|nr:MULTISPECIES: DNA polymerase IV [unclassified Nocardia]MEA3532777.1 DNA polymerase IV [Nocardia sp. CDC192]MEB3509908.1 DNA polymerase IV [Nocardia sp. CDC186]